MTLPTGSFRPPASSTTPSHLPHRAVAAVAACVQFARAAATVDTTTGTLGQTRQAAARAYGTPQLQALYDGPGQGRNPEQQTWELHRAHVTVTAVPVAEDAQDEPAEPDTSAQPRPGTAVAVIVSGTARGSDGWTAPTTPYQLDCVTVPNPVAGWLVDDVAVTVPSPVPAPATG